MTCDGNSSQTGELKEIMHEFEQVNLKIILM